MTVVNFTKKVDAQDVGEVNWNPASESSDGMSTVALGKTPGDDRLFLGRMGDPDATSTASSG